MAAMFLREKTRPRGQQMIRPKHPKDGRPKGGQRYDRDRYLRQSFPLSFKHSRSPKNVTMGRFSEAG